MEAEFSHHCAIPVPHDVKRPQRLSRIPYFLNFFLVQMHLRMRLRNPRSKACVEAGSNLLRKLRLAASTPTRRDLVSRKRCVGGIACSRLIGAKCKR